jgi:CitMHS family citrate-Mg2+:H+ or citrate-Ca2+:H+ symporter
MSDEEFEIMKAQMQKEVKVTVPKPIFIFDIVFTLAIIFAMLFKLVNTNLAFMIAVAVGLIVNFKNPKDQTGVIRKHGGQALHMVMIIFTIGILVGIMNGDPKEGGMMKAITDVLLGVIPESLGKHLSFFLSLVSVPLSMCVGSDTTYMIISPIIGNVTATYGVALASTGVAAMIGACIAANLSLIGATPYLALGLAECEMSDHLKANFFPVWIMGIIGTIVAGLVGAVPF